MTLLVVHIPPTRAARWSYLRPRNRPAVSPSMQSCVSLVYISKWLVRGGSKLVQNRQEIRWASSMAYITIGPFEHDIGKCKIRNNCKLSHMCHRIIDKVVNMCHKFPFSISTAYIDGFSDRQATQGIRWRVASSKAVGGFLPSFPQPLGGVGGIIWRTDRFQ